MILEYIPTFQQVFGLLAVFIVVAAMGIIGVAVAGRHRVSGIGLICGWGVVSLIFTGIGSVSHIPFTYLTLLSALLAIFSYGYVSRQNILIGYGDIGKMVVLTVPLLFLVAGITPSQWDEYSHWLLAARYLFEIDAFPWADLAPSKADYPGYPYSISLITYLVSRTAGWLVENTGALFNSVLIISFALAVVEIVRDGRGESSAQDKSKPTNWGLTAFGFLAVTVLSTTFVQKLIFTAYSDFPTAVILGFAGVAGWYLLDALAKNDTARAKSLAVQMGLALVVLINSRQSNLVLVVFVVAGVFLSGALSPTVGVKKIARYLPLILIGPIAIYVVWNLFVSGNLPGGAQAVRPFSDWQWHILPQVFAVVAKIAVKKGAYFLAMLFFTFWALKSFWRIQTRFDQFAVITATVFIGYNAFLIFTFFAIWGGFSGINALSYWRFNTHLGMLGVACGFYGLAVLSQKYSSRIPYATLGKVAIVLALILPIGAAAKIRFDIRAPKIYVKKVGLEIARTIPKNSHVIILDPLDSGFYAKMMRYQLYGVADVILKTSAFTKETPEKLKKRVAESKATHIWVHTKNKAVDEIVGLALADRTSHLLKRQGNKWQLVKSWPFPGYNLPSDIPD
ncbi:MAG: hypothetical protein HN884_07485 [Rhodospirillaceae bacterium]|jgi:hypothetical protein|nr:hypothetical protein [Rhodospirillaceae bacterium]MBT4589603.1 hypothetical protein [Rhodospirillaceae bacterium]MBT7266699.1 hypothetical protein [Rhodospirillaceae bacterium]